MAKGGSKPGGPQSKNLIPVTQRSPEEAQAIRSKGGKARAKQRHEQALLSQIIRSVLAMGYRKGAVADPNDIYTLEEAKKKNVPIQTLIVMQEVEKYLATGNTESRDWLSSTPSARTCLCRIPQRAKRRRRKRTASAST